MAIVIVLAVFLMCLGVGVALGASAPGGTELSPTSVPGEPQTVEALKEARSEDPEESPHTDPQVAEELPHEELDRSEAEELLEGVFEPEIQGPAGVFDDLRVEKFLAPNVAVIAAGEQPEVPGEEDSVLGAQGALQATLIDSTAPLATETGSGHLEAINLNLEESDDGFLAPVNSPVELEIPDELGSGIELPGPGIKIELEGATGSRSSSILDGSVAFYPNVSGESDLAVSPTPGGVETMTQLRSPESPSAQTYKLGLPPGAALEPKGDGAVVVDGAKTLMTVAPPTALDAQGDSVPTDLSIEGDDLLKIEVAPAASTSYPVLVDPLFQTLGTPFFYPAGNVKGEGWEPNFPSWKSFAGGETAGWRTYTEKSMESFVPWGSKGPDVWVQGPMPAGQSEFWIYRVPRSGTDPLERGGALPETYISRMTVSQVAWRAGSNYIYPYMLMGLYGPSAGWAALYQHEGLQGHGLNELGYTFTFPNEYSVPDVKEAYLGLWAPEAVGNYASNELWVGAATVELSEPANNVPEYAEVAGPPQWVNTGSTTVHFTAKDTGLGLHAYTLRTESGAILWSATENCTGVAESACPFRRAESAWFEPASLPTGIDNLKIYAEDPVGHFAGVNVEVAVDHTKPIVTLSGSATEQATLGMARQAYTLKVAASDGTSAAPQSGVASTKVKIDGQVVDQSAAGCPEENCAVAREWTFESAKYSSGPHTIEVLATDAAGNATTTTLPVTLRPTPPPTVSLSGSLTEQGTLGVTRPHYTLVAKASAAAQSENLSGGLPAYLSSFGSLGTASGKFIKTGGVAIAPKGQLWVANFTRGTVEEFSANGEYVNQLGTLGTGEGQLSATAGTMAVDAIGDVWVADTGNNRLEEFSEAGKFIRQVGAKGTGEGMFTSPEGIAIDLKGNVWVCDRGDGRIEEFTSGGKFLRSVGAKGTGAGQLSEPSGIAIDSKGDLWVADYGANRVVEFSEAGTYLTQSTGSGASPLLHPAAIAVDPLGDVWVGDVGNERIVELGESGTYMNKFGVGGGGAGQFALGRPMGVAIDREGDLWVSDGGHFRVQRWMISPSFVSSFGSAGTGNGQFQTVGGVAVAPTGQLWVAEPAHGRVKEFSTTGEYLGQFGSLGNGQGQLSASAGTLAVDPDGDVWVADTGNNRVEEFSEAGAFIRQVGSAGTGNGQFTNPEGIAIDSNGNVWVADRSDSRLEEFTSEGDFVRSVGTKGVLIGQLEEPNGVTSDGKGGVWITDYAKDCILEFDESGTYVREAGWKGSGNGQLLYPTAITVDPAGRVWVADTGNNRIVEFAETGAYLGKFGTKGIGNGPGLSLANPGGIVSDGTGDAWVSDPGDHRVQKWISGSAPSTLVTEISVDGKNVETNRSSCGTAACSTSTEWTLDPSAYGAGAHTVSVVATDGLGRSTTKSVTIEIQKDIQRPELHATGSLIEAPEGWVEQKRYEVDASTEDKGAGVTELKLKVDGQPVDAATQACPNGGCPFSRAFYVDTSEFAGGSHEAELIAVDGAGNTTTKRWIVNVDPGGHISTREEIQTLEAVESTSEATPVAPTGQLLEAEQRESGDDPGLEVSGSQITSTGVPDVTTMTTDLGQGFSITSPEGTTTVTPVLSGTASGTVVAAGVAAATANVAREVDSVVRPEYNGVQIAQSIRSAESPETFAWKVNLAPRQHLVLANPSQAQVVYSDGVEAFLITAEPAHDATGKPVPTSLEVNGDELLVKVGIHSGDFVYPIMAGQGWETSYQSPVIVQGPEDETQIREREEREAKEREEREQGNESEAPPPPPPAGGYFSESEANWILRGRPASTETVPAPEPAPSGAATASRLQEQVVRPLKDCQIDSCSIWWIELRNPSYQYQKLGRGTWFAAWHQGTQAHCQGWWNTIYSPELEVEGSGCGGVGPEYVESGEGKHLTVFGRYTVKAGFFLPSGDVFVKSEHPALQIWVWPNGSQVRVIKHWDTGETEI